MTKGIAHAASPGLDPQQYLTLLELSKAIALHRNLPDLFHDLSGRLHDVLECHNLSIVLYDDSQSIMRAHILETSEPAMREFLRELPIEGSISGWVWQNQQPFVTADVQQETRFPIAKLVRDFPVTSVCDHRLVASLESVCSFIHPRTREKEPCAAIVGGLVTSQFITLCVTPLILCRQRPVTL